ncbi:MAG: hypothetical protein IKU53_02670, partial [Firmicutes bacterium]|nr:hypothetical protein [Bacillota bacterium]
MANNDYKDTIGDKIDQSLRDDEVAMLGDLLQMPSQETIDIWADEADKRLYKRAQRKKVLSLCAIVVIVCISAVMLAKGITVPNAEAGLEKDTDIETSMESVTQYPSWDMLPEDIKSQLIEFKEFPEGYEIECVEVEDSSNMTKVVLKVNNTSEEFYIREVVFHDGSIGKNIIMETEDPCFSVGETVHVEKYYDSNN